jgi:hemoglobin/transferrin/lactoferrin receptor protein
MGAVRTHRLRLTLDHLDNHTYTNGLSGVAPTASASTSVIGLSGRDTIGEIASALIGDGRGGRDRDGAGHRLVSKSRQSPIFGRGSQYGGGPHAPEHFCQSGDRPVGGIALQPEHGPAVPCLHLWRRRQHPSAGVRDGTVPPTNETFPTRAFPPTDFTLAGFYLGDEIGVGARC